MNKKDCLAMNTRFSSSLGMWIKVLAHLKVSFSIAVLLSQDYITLHLAFFMLVKDTFFLKKIPIIDALTGIQIMIILLIIS